MPRQVAVNQRLAKDKKDVDFSSSLAETLEMKIYHGLDVALSVQNLGSRWVGILRGPTEGIELTFNGLFNLMATNGNKEFRGASDCLATFWTSQKQMRRFFFNQYFIPKTDYPVNGKVVRRAMRFAHEKIAELLQHQERFLHYEAQIITEDFTSGTITAERPDTDMKDAMIISSFNDKG